MMEQVQKKVMHWFSIAPIAIEECHLVATTLISIASTKNLNVKFSRLNEIKMATIQCANLKVTT